MFLNQPRLPEEEETLAEKAIRGGAQKQVMFSVRGRSSIDHNLKHKYRDRETGVFT